MSHRSRSTAAEPPPVFTPVAIAVRAAVAAGILLVCADVRAQDAAAAPDAAASGTQRVVVSGARPPDYAAERSAATKIDTPLIETAQSVSVVTREQMTDQAVQTSEQALRYTAGVQTETNGFDLRHEAYLIRGFDPGPVYVDGLRTFKSGSYGDWIAEPQGLERVEVIKGPASVTYGQGAPGGIVDLVTKKPDAAAMNEVDLTIGNHDRYQTTFDLGGRLDAPGLALFRINGLARDSGTQVDFGKDDRLYLAPSVSWSPSVGTKLTLLADVVHDRLSPKDWWPATLLTAPLPFGRPPVSRDTGEPGFDHYDRNAQSLTAQLEQRLSPDWRYGLSARYGNYELDYRQIYAYDIEDDARTLDRASLASRSRGRTFTIDNRLQSELHTGDVTHKLLFGIDYQHFNGSQDQAFGSASALDMYAPAYGDPDVELPTPTHTDQRLEQTGLYAQEQAHWGAWVANVGLRHDTANSRTAQDGDALSTHDSRMTYNAGLLYHDSSGFAPYLSVSSSFQPTLDTGFDGTPFKPLTARQVEAGVKYQPQGSMTLVTLSVFDLRERNIETDDPDHPDYSVQTGDVRARGIELEGVANLGRQLDLVASYTYLDTKVTSTTIAENLGQPLFGTSRNAAKLWLGYRFANEALRGWRIGAGARYVGRAAASDDGTVYDRPSTMFDAGIGYTNGPVTVSVNGSNLADKVTVVGDQFYGQGRAVQGTVGYRW